jgi:hypothetical protein
MLALQYFQFQMLFDDAKNADVIQRPKAFNHVGLLCNRPPGEPGCLLFSCPTNCIFSPCRNQ